MSVKGWRYALASVVGTSHRRLGRPGQDRGACQTLRLGDGGQVLIAVAADGAGSASHAEIGAEIACSRFLDELAAAYQCGRRVGDLSRDFFADWLDRFRDDVRRRAETDGRSPRDFACTLLGAIVETDAAVFVQVGDGAIVTSDDADPDSYACVFWPRRGEYANATYFATDARAADYLEFARRDGRIAEVALLSDGLQGLALEYQNRGAHVPFFRPVFAPIRTAPAGYSPRLSSALAAFLGSSRVEERTDDDKTLILASRRKRPGRRTVPMDDCSRETQGQDRR